MCGKKDWFNLDLKAFAVSLVLIFLWTGIPTKALSEEGKVLSESWMGVYMNGIKVGYSHVFERTLTQEGKDLIKSRNESRVKVSRLGGGPIEILTVQESLYSSEKKPMKTEIRTKMSGSETVITAEASPDTIVFWLGDDVVKEMPYAQEFYFGVPLHQIIASKGLEPGYRIDFKILDPVAYSLSDCIFEVIGQEDILIFGEMRRLWHVRSELASIVPIVVDEWIDEEGEVFKSIMESGFISSVSLKMPKEKALEESTENFDIAFSSIIASNLILPEPQKVRSMKLRVWGISEEKFERFPRDDGSQRMRKEADGSFVIQTASLIFMEKDATALPVQEENIHESLASTIFCQSNDKDLQKTARRIVGEERNSWRAAKKIAEWVKLQMTPSYNVGFATAREILQAREGDCTEYTVLTVALCRAGGIPARAALGIMYADGIFAYHMWPEMYVGQWVGLDARWLAQDEESGEYYTDATHIKFGHSNLDEKLFQEMAQSISEVIGNIQLEILEYNTRIP